MEVITVSKIQKIHDYLMDTLNTAIEEVSKGKPFVWDVGQAPDMSFKVPDINTDEGFLIFVLTVVSNSMLEGLLKLSVEGGKDKKTLSRLRGFLLPKYSMSYPRS
jgi:hypothetical protein